MFCDDASTDNSSLYIYDDNNNWTITHDTDKYILTHVKYNSPFLKYAYLDVDVSRPVKISCEFYIPSATTSNKQPVIGFGEISTSTNLNEILGVYNHVSHDDRLIHARDGNVDVTSSYTSPQNAWFTMELIATETQVISRVYQNNELKAEKISNSNNIQRGKPILGYGCWSNSYNMQIYFKNYKVTPLD